MRKKSLLLILAGCALLSGCSSDPGNLNNHSEDTINKSAVTEEGYTQNSTAVDHETSLAKKLREARSKPNRIDALNIVKAETRYDADFVPTVYLEVENTSETTIKAFEVRADDINFTKQIKVSIAPQNTYSTSFRITDKKGVSGDIVLSVNRFIYSDGTMVEASNR